MNNRSQENNAFYEDYEKNLSIMIFEKAKKEIPESMCKRLAKQTVCRKKYDDSKGKNKTMEEYAEACIWAYFQ